MRILLPSWFIPGPLTPGDYKPQLILNTFHWGLLYQDYFPWFTLLTSPHRGALYSPWFKVIAWLMEGTTHIPMLCPSSLTLGMASQWVILGLCPRGHCCLHGSPWLASLGRELLHVSVLSPSSLPRGFYCLLPGFIAEPHPPCTVALPHVVPLEFLSALLGQILSPPRSDARRHERGWRSQRS